MAHQLAFTPLQRETIALGYQFGYLVPPALVPAMLWLALDRRFLPTLLFEREPGRLNPLAPERKSHLQSVACLLTQGKIHTPGAEWVPRFSQMGGEPAGWRINPYRRYR